MQDLYTILGVSPDASDEDIRHAYRQIARRLHPDVNKHPGAARQFKDVSAAHDILGSISSRAQYDVKRRGQVTKQYLDIRVTPSTQVVSQMSEPQVMYVLVELSPDMKIGREETSAPLNLTLVIDHSTSMSGARMDRTKIAAHKIIESLSKNDVLSVVTFADRAEVLLKAAPLTDKNLARAMVSTIQAAGGTEMYSGLVLGYEQNQRYAGKNFVNHIILITDGRTYGDEANCIELAERCAKEGIGLSAMGIGEEWNDAFLDHLVSMTGGASQYIASPNSVQRFLEERVKSLGQSVAERVTISVAPDPDVQIESIFRITPNPQQLATNLDPLPVGQIQAQITTSMLLTLLLPPLPEIGFRPFLRVVATADILWDQYLDYRLVADASIEVSARPPKVEPPLAILDALGKLTLYRMQLKAAEAAAKGDIKTATRTLENVATRLLASGHTELANIAMSEARRLANTHALSEEGKKTLKYGTRMLLLTASDGT